MVSTTCHGVHRAAVEPAAASAVRNATGLSSPVRPFVRATRRILLFVAVALAGAQPSLAKKPVIEMQTPEGFEHLDKAAGPGRSRATAGAGAKTAAADRTKGRDGTTKTGAKNQLPPGFKPGEDVTAVVKKVGDPQVPAGSKPGEKAAATVKKVVDAQTPPGFEGLLKPRKTFVDVIFTNQVIGQALAHYKPGFFKFQTPRKTILALNLVKKSRVEQAVKALTGWVPANADRLCNSDRKKGCGRLQTKTAGVIFEEGRFRAYLFINPKWLAASAGWRKKYLASPKTGPSVVTHIDGAFAGSTHNGTSLNIRTSTVAAWRDFRLRADLSFDPSAGIRPDTLTAEFDRRWLKLRGGYFRANGSRLLPEVRIYGFHAGTSTDTRIDLEQAFGSQIIVLLERESYVEIRREGRIVSAGYYPPGNQLLNTSQLPSGAYPITIRIKEVGGRTREVTRFFAKSALIPPKDLPLVFVEGGFLTIQPENGLAKMTDIPYGNAAFRIRLTDGLSIGAQASGTDREGAFEANLYYLNKWFRFGVSGLYTTAGDWGATADLSANWRDLNLFANARYIRAGRTPIKDTSNPANFRFVNGNQIQINGGLIYSIGSVRLGLTGVWRRGHNEKATWSIGPNIFAPLWQHNGHHIWLRGEFLKTNDGYTGYAKIVYQWRRPKFTLATTAGLSGSSFASEGSKVRPSARADIEYRAPKILDHDINLRGVVAHDRDSTIGGDVRIQGPKLRFEGGTRHTFGRNSSNTSYTATLSTGIAVNMKGVAIGGRDRQRSAIIIRIVGGEATARYRVIVNGNPRGVVRRGRGQPIFLPPYKKYRVKIKPEESGFVQLDATEKTVILYPGTVATLRWEITKINVVFGKIVRPDGKPVAAADIKGAAGVAETDPSGNFQAEIRGTSLSFTLTTPEGDTCKVALKRIKPKDGYANVGTLVCK